MASHAILNFILGRTPINLPATWFVDFSSTPLGIDGIGVTPPTDPAWQRIAITNNKTNFTVASNRTVTLTSELLGVVSTTNWNRMTHFMIYGSLTGNDMWFYGDLRAPGLDIQIDTIPWVPPNMNDFRYDICGGSDNDMAISTPAANAILDYIFGQTPITIPPIFYLGSSTTPITPDGVGITEPVAAEYQRFILPNDKNTFSVAANKTITLASEFRSPVSLTPWGNLTSFFITDTPTGTGNIWWSGSFVHNRNVEVTTALTLIPNGFNWTLDSCIPTVTETSSLLMHGRR